MATYQFAPPLARSRNNNYRPPQRAPFRHEKDKRKSNDSSRKRKSSSRSPKRSKSPPRQQKKPLTLDYPRCVKCQNCECQQEAKDREKLKKLEAQMADLRRKLNMGMGDAQKKPQRERERPRRRSASCIPDLREQPRRFPPRQYSPPKAFKEVREYGEPKDQNRRDPNPRNPKRRKTKAKESRSRSGAKGEQGQQGHQGHQQDQRHSRSKSRSSRSRSLSRRRSFSRSRSRQKINKSENGNSVSSSPLIIPTFKGSKPAPIRIVTKPSRIVVKKLAKERKETETREKSEGRGQVVTSAPVTAQRCKTPEKVEQVEKVEKSINKMTDDPTPDEDDGNDKSDDETHDTQEEATEQEKPAAEKEEGELSPKHEKPKTPRLED
jgi:hypothetical protein